MHEHQLAVIATNSFVKKAPESALVAFVEDDNLCIYFQTGKYTRKAQNLKKSPYVSFVIGHNLHKWATLQYEGKAQHLYKQYQIDFCKKMFKEKNSPTTEEFLERPDTILYKVIPTWIGFSDYRGSKQPSVIEMSEFN